MKSENDKLNKAELEDVVKSLILRYVAEYGQRTVATIAAKFGWREEFVKICTDAMALDGTIRRAGDVICLVSISATPENVKQAFIDVTDGMSVHDLVANTGLSEVRCREIYNLAISCRS